MLKAIDMAAPRLRRNTIWDVQSLIVWMRNEIVGEKSIFQVSRRLALILLLASGRRVHDLTLLRIDDDNMVLTKDFVCFWPEFGSKTDRASHRQSGWKLLRHKEKVMDPVFWSSKLLEVSQARRNGERGSRNLFLTSRGVAGPASRTVIAGWVRSALKSAGIDFSAGSMRSAVASKRWSDGVPLDDILKCGNWRGKNNVFKHYFKQVERKGPAKKLVTTLVCDDSFVAV